MKAVPWRQHGGVSGWLYCRTAAAILAFRKLSRRLGSNFPSLDEGEYLLIPIRDFTYVSQDFRFPAFSDPDNGVHDYRFRRPIRNRFAGSRIKKRGEMRSGILYFIALLVFSCVRAFAFRCRLIRSAISVRTHAPKIPFKSLNFGLYTTEFNKWANF